MPLPHEQIASQEYWEGPNIPYQKNPSLPILLANLAFTEGLLADVEAVYNKSLSRGCEALPLEAGRDLHLPGAGRILKIVEDTRLTPKKPIDSAPDEWLQGFDEDANTMAENLWYGGPSVRVNVTGQDGVFSISRHVFYAVSPMIGEWPVAKHSAYLGRDHVVGRQLQPRSVGQIAISRTRKGKVEQKYVSAEIITPAPPKPAAQKARRTITLPTLSFDGGANPAFGTA